MVEEEILTSSAPEPSDGTVVAADNHKRKLEDLELNNNGGDPLTDSEAKPDPEPVNDEENGSAEESETKRPRLENTGDYVTEADALVTQNGHQEEEKEEPEEEKPEQTVSADDNDDQSVESHEPVKEQVETVIEDPISSENQKPETETAEELGQPKVENEEPLEELPNKGDVPVPSTEMQSGSDTQILSRKMQVPSDKVGVLIGKAGDTIRSLQDNSGAKIQIMRDADADPRAPSRPLELVGTLENINKAEKLIKDVIAEADAGGSPSLVARGFSTDQAASGGEQLEIQVPIEKVGVIIGKGGETIRNMQTRSGARIQLIQQNVSDGDQSKERIVRITGNKRQIETAREMIKDVMNQTARQSPLSGGYNQQGFRPRGPHHAQFSGYDYPQRGSYPCQNSQYPPPTYGNYPPPPRSNFGPSWEQRPPASMHGPSAQGNYNYGQQQGPGYGHTTPYSQPYNRGYNDTSSQQLGHMGSQPTQQDQYGKPPKGPVSSYGQNMLPPQQTYPYPSSGPPVQQTYPPYGSGYPPYNQPVAQQQAPQAAGYGSSYPTAQPGYAQQPAATYGYPTDPAYAQQSQTQPAYDQSGGYANVPAPQAAAYPQYDSTQMYH